MTQPPKKGKGKSKGKGKAVKEPGTGKSVEEVSQNRYYSVRLYLILHDVSKNHRRHFQPKRQQSLYDFSNIWRKRHQEICQRKVG